MNRPLLSTSLSAFVHIVIFAFIVLGGGAVMFVQIEASRHHTVSSEVSQPIPELARWTAQ